MPIKETVPLYRIYDIKNEEYLPLNNGGYEDDYRWYFVDGDGKVYQLVNRPYGFIRVGLNQNNYIIEKCTGLQEKAGIYIYEGDILGVYGHKYQVIYDNGILVMNPIRKTKGTDKIMYLINIVGYTIIGTIHD